MAYGSSKEGGYGAVIPVTRRDESDHGADAASSAFALGKVHSPVGAVTITRPSGHAVPAHAGAFVFGTDVIETGADGCVIIVFADGSQFRLAPNTELALDGTFSTGTTRTAALLRIVKGVFAFMTGPAAAGRFVIDTPVGRVQSSAQAIGVGSFTLGALTLGLIHDLKAASADLGLLDDGTIDPRELKHGIFEILTKELHPRRIVVDDPKVKIILRPEGSGSVSVSEASNTPEMMGQQQTAYQGVYGLFFLGQHDPFIQQWGNPNDHASVEPQTIFGSDGSSTSPSLLTQSQINDGIPSELTSGSSPNTSGSDNQPIVFGGITPSGGFPLGGGGTVVIWASSTNGNWNQAPGWNTGQVPGSGNTVEILTPVTVTLNADGSAGELVIAKGATLDIAGGGSLTMTGNINNSGTIVMDDPTLNISGTVQASGGGVISMLGASTFNVIAGVPNTGATLENVDNTISGSGIIGQGDGNLTFVNDAAGTVNANVDGDGIQINTGNTDVNAGIFEASNGGTLTITDSLTNSGKLEAIGGVVDVAGAVAGAGSASVSAGGTFEIGSTDAQAFAFLGDGTLKLDAGSDFTGNVSLAAGAIIDLAGVAVTKAVFNGSTLFINGAPTTFSVSDLPSGDTFAFKSDGAGGTDVAVLPQVLTVSSGPAAGSEGAHIQLDLSETLAGGATLTSLKIGGIPDGTTLTNSNGDTFTVTNGHITFDAAQIADGVLNGLSIIETKQGAFTLSVLATATDGNDFHYTVPVKEAVTVDAAGPVLGGATSTTVTEGNLVTFGATDTKAFADDVLGNVTITGLPHDLTNFNGGHYDASTGTWAGTAAQFNALTFDAGGDGHFTLTISATTQGATAPTTGSYSLTIDPTAPTVSPTAVSGVDGQPIALNLGIAVTGHAGDSNSLYSVTLSDIPSGATLTNTNGDTLVVSGGSITFDKAQLAAGVLNGLSLIAVDDGNFTLHVSAQEQGAGNTLSTIAVGSESVTVNPAGPLTLLTGDGLGGQIITPFQYLHYSVLDAASQSPNGTFTATDINYSGDPNPGPNQNTVAEFLNYNHQNDGNTIVSTGETNVADSDVGNLYIQTDGYIALKAGVTYTFSLDSDDGAVLSLNGAALIDRDGPHDDSTPTTVSFTPKTTGFYEIGISYYANGFGGSELQAQYSTDGGATFNDLTSAVLSRHTLETAVGGTVTMSNAVTDGASNSTVTITGLPDGLDPASFSGGSYNASTGTWTGTAAQFNALTFDAGQVADTYDLTIAATVNGNPSETATGKYALVVTEQNTWTGLGNDGHWSDAANWSLHTVPGSNDQATIETSGTVVVTSNAAADSLTLTPDSQLEVASGHTLTLAGPDESHLLGSVHIDAGGTLADDWSAQLAGTIDGSIYGGSTLKIGDVACGVIASLSVNNGDSAILEDITVNGGGSINVGTQVLATPDTDATALTLEGTTVNGGYINIGPNATLFAENDCFGNGDTLSGVTVDNAGSIQVDSGQVLTILTLVDTTVTGGNFLIGSAGKLQVEGTSTLDGVAVTNENEIKVDEATSGAILVLDDGTSISGGTLDIGCVGHVEIGGGPIAQGAKFDNLTVDNFGNVQIDTDAALTIAGTVTLEDGGTVTLVAGDPASIAGVDDNCGRPAELDNVDNIIQGAGQIGAGDGQLNLVNEICGVVDANSSGNVLLLDTGHIILNAGTLEATSGGILQIDDNVCNTHCGELSASGEGSLVNLLNATITGGTIETDSCGWVQTVTDAQGGATTSTFDGVTIASGSQVQVSDGTSLVLEQPIDNQGTIYLGGTQLTGGQDPALVIDGCVTLTGHGNIVLNESTFTNEDSIVSGNGGGTLTNVNDTISGGGTIGDSGLALVNQSCGTIDADLQYNALILDTGSNCITNQGVLESTRYGDLVINSALDNSCGTVSASGGGYVQVEGTIHGGQATIADGTIEFDAYANVATSFTCGDQGALVLGKDASFAGAVSNFAAGDAVDFLGVNFSNSTQLSYCSSNDTLTVSDGQGDSQTIKLAGHYCQSDFQLFNDGSGHAAITVLQSDPGSDNWITDSPTGNSYQYVSDSTASWLIAQAGAVSAGGYLASVTDTEQNNFILNNVTQGHTAWLGGSDQEAATGSDHAANWYWVAGPDAVSSFTYANWNAENTASPEPNNVPHPPYNIGEHFLQFLSDGTWNDEQGPIVQSATTTDGYVIEQSPSVSAGVVLADPAVVSGTSNVVGDISFFDPNADDTFDASVLAKGPGYAGEVSLTPVAQNGNTASLGFEFDLGNDQINLAPGQTLTQSYGLTVADHSGLTVQQTVSVSFGGPGNDNFVFAPGIGADTIVNFNPQADTIELDGFANIHGPRQLASLISNDAHGDAVIELGHNDSVTVAGMTAAQLQAHLSSFVHLH